MMKLAEINEKCKYDFHNTIRNEIKLIAKRAIAQKISFSNICDS